MLRGAGTHGLCGIDPVRDGRYLRPLIADSGEAIRLWCKENYVGYVTDSTNTDTEYTRNHIRHNIVGEMKKICSDPTRAAYRMTELTRRDEEYLDSVASSHLGEGETAVDRDVLKSLHPAISSRVLRKMYSSVKRGSSTLGEVHIRELLLLANSPTTYAKLSLPGKITAKLDRDTVSMMSDEDNSTDEAKPFGIVFVYPSDGKIFENSLYKLTFSPTEHNHHESNRKKDENIYKLSILTTLRFDKIKGVLTVKYREAGDTYRYGGMTRKVKKLLSDKKMGTIERSLLPILCDEEGIVWIPGFPPRDDVKYTGEGEPVYISCDKITL
jgi:tRNA(Ile)-lysidine synthase